MRFNNLHAIAFDAKRVFGGAEVAFIPSLNIRALLGDEAPVPFTNTMGGSLAGRYLEQQMPFIGVNNAAAMGRTLGIARADFRIMASRNNYLTAIYNYAVSARSFEEAFKWHVLDYHGFGLQYTYNSIIGPLSFNVHWSDYTDKVGAYVSLGFDF